MPDWVAKMTARQGYRAKHAFGSWAMWSGPQWGPMWFGGRGPKARRGDVRAAILAVLAESAMNGYQIIQQIAAAMWHIASVGTAEQQRLGREALADLRRQLHTILAEDETRE